MIDNHQMELKALELFRQGRSEEANRVQDWKAGINPDSLEVITDVMVEPSVSGAEPGSRYQFERLGYFCVDPDSSERKLVFNRTVTLKDTWAKIPKRGG